MSAPDLRMRHRVRRVCAVVVLAHGLLHLIGPLAAAGVETPLTRVPTVPEAVLWAVGMLAVAAAAAGLWRGASWYWWACLAAAVVSQAAILTDWTDAAAGTPVNLLLVGCAVYGFAEQGPRSFAARYRRSLRAYLAGPGPGRLVREGDLADLPACVATHVRRSGAVGKPIPIGFEVCLAGRIRTAASGVWMPFTATQFNDYSAAPVRLFHLRGRARAIPMDVFHRLAHGRATMRVRVASLVTVADAQGPEMDRAETVTLLNDICLFAPALLLTVPVTWVEVTPDTAEVTYAHGSNTVSAVLTFDASGDLATFRSDDRARSSADGKAFERIRWSTPIDEYGEFGEHRAIRRGRGVWGGTADTEEFTYIDMTVLGVTYR